MLASLKPRGLEQNCLNWDVAPPPLPNLLHFQQQGRKHGHIRYKDFVKAMTDTSARGRGTDGGGNNRGGRSRPKGGRAERRRRSSADHIERLVDRLKGVRKSNVSIMSDFQANFGIQCAAVQQTDNRRSSSLPQSGTVIIRRTKRHIRYKRSSQQLTTVDPGTPSLSAHSGQRNNDVSAIPAWFGCERSAKAMHSHEKG